MRWMKIHPRTILSLLLMSVLCMTVIMIELSQRTDITTVKLSQNSALGSRSNKKDTQTSTDTVPKKSRKNNPHIRDELVDETVLRGLVEKKSDLEKLKPTSRLSETSSVANMNHLQDAIDKNKVTQVRSHSNHSALNKIIRPDTCNGCFQHGYKLIIENSVCEEGKDKSEVRFIILIFSKLNSIKRRTAIRETWASYSKNNTGSIRYAFLFGDQGNSKNNQKLLDENLVYQDILQEDFVDSYQNLTLKSMMAFKWASEYCSKAEYFMKTDDDTWINMPRLMTLLPHANLSNSMIGMCAYYNTGPIRDKKYTKWYIPVERYPHNVYPQYCAGSGYVTSVDVATKVFAISKDIPFFEMEDVYVGLCLHTIGIRRRHVPGFESYHIKYKKCLYNSDKMYTNHYMTPELMYRAWNENCRTH